MNLSMRLQLTLIARLFNAIADQVLIFVVPIYIYQVSKSLLLTALTFGIEWIPRLIALPVSGALADKFGGKILFQISDLSRLVLTLVLFTVVTIFPEPHFVAMGILVGCVGFFHEQSFMGLESSIPKVVKGEKLLQFQSKLQFVDIFGQIAGPAISAFAIGFIDVSYLFLTVSIVYLMSFISISAMPRISSNYEEKSIVKCISLGITTLFETKELIELTAYTFLLNLTYGAVLSMTPPYVQKYFQWSPSDYGLLMTSIGILSAIIFLVIPLLTRRIKALWLGRVAYSFVIIGSVLLCVSQTATIYVASFFLILIGDALFNVYMRTERVKYIPEDKLGVVIGSAVLVNLSALPIASALVGIADELLHTNAYYLAILFLSLCTPIYFKWAHITNQSCIKESNKCSVI